MNDHRNHNRLRARLLVAGLVLCVSVPAFGAPDDPEGPNGAPPAGFPAPAPDRPATVDPEATSDTAVAGRTLELSLARAVELGMQANLGLQAERYGTPMAHQGFIAAEAAFDRLLTAGFEVAQQEQPSTFTFTGSRNNESDAVSGSVGVTQRLLRGGSVALLYSADRIDSNSVVAAVNPAFSNGLTLEVIRPLLRGAGDVGSADIRRAQNGIAAARANFASRVEGVLLQIVSAYWELVFAGDNVDARDKSLEVAKELMGDAQARLDSDVGTPLDVAEARAGVERRRSELLQAENQRGTVEDALQALIMPFGRQALAGVRIIPTDSSRNAPARTPATTDSARYLQAALSGRPELRVAKAGISDRSLDMIVAFDAIRPQLDITGRIVSSGLDEAFGRSLGDVLQREAVTASIGVQFSMFIGQRAARAGWRTAGWARRQAVLRLRELENEIVVEVRGALRDLSTARALFTAAQAEVSAAREGWEGEQDIHHQGKSTPFRVLQKEDDLTAARTRLGRSAADIRIAESALWKAIGLLAQNLGAKIPKFPACCR